MARLRLSPSGPFIENAEGGVADPGNGFQLRLDEAGGSVGMGALTDVYQEVLAVSGGAPFEASLLLPDPNRRYRVNAHLDAQCVTLDDALDLRLMAAYDGVNFVNELAENTHAMLVDSTVRFGIDMVMQLGSAFGTPLPAGSPSLSVRLQARAVTAGRIVLPTSGQNGSCLLTLTELL